MPLPPGTILNPATGEIAGVPTQAGTFAFQLKVRDLLGTQRVLDEDIAITAYTPMSLTSGYAAAIMQTRAYSSTPVVAGGVAPITYTLHAGALPGGLSLNAGTAAITGTPSANGTFPITVRATDALSQVFDFAASLVVLPNLTLAFVINPDAMVGQPYDSGLPTVTSGTAPFVFSLTGGSLPAEFTLNPTTGRITGTLPAPGSYPNLVVTVTDANGFTATSGAPQTIASYAPPSLSGALAGGMQTRAYSSTYTRSAGKSPFSYVATGLPPGLTINATTGEITGTPSANGTYTPNVTVTDALGATASRSNQVIIAQNLTISGSVPSGTRNIAYSFTPTASGGTAPRTFALQSGSLPAGITLNSSTGVISGTPSTQQTTAAVLRVTDSLGFTATMSVNITIAGDLALTGSTPSTGTTTVAYSGTTFGGTGGVLPYSWSATGLPPGLGINSSTGAITGTPTTPGTYSIDVFLTDSGGSSANYAGSIVVAAFPALSGTLPDATNGSAYSASYTRTGGHTPFSYTISAGALPTGLTINPSTGVISGTPTVNGAYTFTVRVQDNLGNFTTRAQTVNVSANPSLSGTLTADTEAPYTNGTDPTAYSSGLTLSGGQAPVSWSVSGTLPPGLSISGSTGVISGNTGVISESGGLGYTDYNFTVNVVDALGRTANRAQTIRVYWHVRGVGTFSPATQGVAYSQSITSQYGKAAITYSLQSGVLPTGLSLSAGGTISGTPSTSGSPSITVRLTDALGKTADVSQTFVCYPAATVSGAGPDGTSSVAYSYSYTGGGGNGTNAFSVSAGSLPPGLSLSSAGVLSGTPTTPGTYNFTVRNTSAGSQATVADTIVIVAMPSIAPVTPRGTETYAYTGSTNGSAGQAPYTYSISAGALPGGLSLNSSTGAITGTPTTAGTYNFTLRLTDNLGNQTTSARSVTIAAALAQSLAYASGQDTVAYSSTSGASGGWSPYTYAVQSGSLPTGLSLNASTGAITGTPSAVGTFNFTIRVTDADGNIKDTAKTIVIAAAPVALNVTISPSPCYEYEPSDGSFVNNVTCYVTASVTGSVGALSYAWTKEGGGSSAFASVSGASTDTLSLSKTAKFFYASEDWRCTVTDAGNGATAYAIVNITGEIG